MQTKTRSIDFVEVMEPPDFEDNPSYNSHIAYLTRDLLLEIGEDPSRAGLKRTPERVARMYEELLSGYQTGPVSLVNGAIFESDYHNMVVVRDIEYYSLCEHHLLPFFGHAHVAYIPDGKIIGLSKIPRLVEMYARRLQVQERMTQQIAEALNDILKPRGVAVLVEGSHMCAMMRGVKKVEASMVTSATLGAFGEDEKIYRQFTAQLRQNNDIV
jgi:GTP cyclohydrolase I